MTDLDISQPPAPAATIGGPVALRPAPERRRRGHGSCTLARLILGSGNGVVGISIVLVVVLVGVLAPLIAPHDPNDQDLIMVTVPPVWEEGGSSEYLLGTDNLGRDLLSRLLY